MLLSRDVFGLPLGLALGCALASPAGAADGVGILVETTNFTALKQVGVPQKIEFHFGFSNSYDRPTSALRMIPFTHDWDDDGLDSLGYYNQREGRFYFSDENNGGHIDHVIDFGQAQDLQWFWPVVLDKVGDVGVEVGVYDIRLRRFSFQDPSVGSFTWGQTDAIPIVGDWNGDGVQTLGLYSIDNQAFLLNDNMPPSGTTQYILYGAANVLPIAGDWDDDGADEVGYFDPRAQRFHRFQANNITFSEPFFDGFTEFQFTYENETPPLGNRVWLEAEMLPVAGTWDTENVGEPAPYAWLIAGPDDHPFNTQDLDALIAAIGSTDPENPYAHVNSLVVAYNGKLVRQAYFNGWDQNKSHHMMSMTKSVLSALFGIAINLGYVPDLDPGQTMEDLLDGTSLASEYTNSPVYSVCGDDEIDLLDVMTMTSGYYHHNNGSTTGSNPSNFEAAGLFASDDWVEWTLNGPESQNCNAGWWSLEDVGTFKYYGGNNHVAAEFLRRRVVSMYSSLYEFAKQELCDPLGITLTRWDHEPSSNVLPAGLGQTVYYGESQMFMRPLDLARFGQLFLDGGTLGTNTVVTQQWVDESTSDLIAGDGTLYGCWWWRENLSGSPICYKGKLGYQALGYGGQHVWVYPELHVVIVITSEWRDLTESGSGTQISKNEQIRNMVLNAMAGVTGSCN